MNEAVQFEWLGTSEAARRLRVHEMTIRRWTETGRLPCVRDSSGKRLFTAAMVDKFAAERAKARR